MGLRIVTTSYEAAGASAEPPDAWVGRVVKYIPSDIVGGWLAASNMIESANGIPRQTVLWVTFVVGLALTYMIRIRLTKLHVQSAISTLAFALWVFALGGPFRAFAWFHPVYPSLVLIGFTIVVGFIPPEK